MKRGGRCSLETRKKMSLAHKGEKHSKEHNRKVSEAQKKRFRENPELRLRYVGDRNPAKRPEVRKKISEKRKGHSVSKETRMKISKSLKGRKQSKELIEKRSKIMHDIKRTTEWKKNISIALKKKWRDDKDYIEKQKKISVKNFYLSGTNRKTEGEKKLEKILNRLYPNEWKYVGDGEFFVGKKCPDFVHKSKKFVIELNGPYWHKVYAKDFERKLKVYDEHKYRCVVLWEKELNKNTVKEGIEGVQ